MKQKKWVKELEKVALAPLMVSGLQQDGKTPSYRYYLKDHDWFHPYQFRRCLTNQLLFDIDEKDWDLLRIYCEPLLEYLRRNKIPFLLSGTGGSGCHLEIVFDAIDYQKMCGFREVRLALFNYILDDIGLDKGLRGAGQPYCNAVIQFSDMSEYGKILREFGGSKNGRRKTLIHEIPYKRDMMYDTETLFPERIDVWNVPIGILESFELKTRHLKYPLKCDICPVDRTFIYEQSHYVDDWGEFKVKLNSCSDCSGELIE